MIVQEILANEPILQAQRAWERNDSGSFDWSTAVSCDQQKAG